MTFCFKNVNGGRGYTSEVKCLPRARFDHQDKQELEDKDLEEERRGRRGDSSSGFGNSATSYLFF